MIINDLSIRKMAKNDPRYPDPVPGQKTFSDVYLFTCETDAGPLECPFFVFETMTPERTNVMLRLFGGAIARAEKEAA